MITEIASQTFTDVNVLIKMFTNDHKKWEGMVGVMSKDLDCDEVVSLTYYPKEESALTAYNKLIAAYSI